MNRPDIFSLYSGYMKKTLKNPIDLGSEELPTLIVPSNFKRFEMPNVKKSYFSEIRDFISGFAQEAEENGFGGNMFTALYEGVLNAYTHGNKCDDNKSVMLSTNIKDNKLEFIIEDEGDKLHPDFMRFILAHREKSDNKSNFINWYKFSEAQKRNEYNNGTGTSFMHAYMDNVLYYKSNELGGLAVYLQKNK